MNRKNRFVMYSKLNNKSKKVNKNKNKSGSVIRKLKEYKKESK